MLEQTRTPLATARQRHQEAQEQQRDLDQQLHQARTARQAALNAHNDAEDQRLNQLISELNVALRFAITAVEDTRQQVTVEQTRVLRVRNQLANAGNEADRLARDLSHHQERVAALQPQLAEARARHVGAQRQLAELEEV